MILFNIGWVVFTFHLSQHCAFSWSLLLIAEHEILMLDWNEVLFWKINDFCQISGAACVNSCIYTRILYLFSYSAMILNNTIVHCCDLWDFHLRKPYLWPSEIFQSKLCEVHIPPNNNAHNVRNWSACMIIWNCKAGKSKCLLMVISRYTKCLSIRFIIIVCDRH